MKGGLKCASMIPGELFVMTILDLMMLPLFVSSWGMLILEVSKYFM